MSLQQAITRRSLAAVENYLQGDVMRRQFGSSTMINQLSTTNHFTTMLTFEFREGIEYRFDVDRHANLIVYGVTRNTHEDNAPIQLIEHYSISLRTAGSRQVVEHLHHTLESFLTDLKTVHAQMSSSANVVQAMTMNLTLTDGAPIQHLQFLSGVYLLTGGVKYMKEITALYVLGRFELRPLLQAFDVKDILGTARPRIRPIVQNVEDRTQQRLGMKNSYQLFSWSAMPVKISTYGTYRVRAEREIDDTQDFTPVNILEPNASEVVEPPRQITKNRITPSSKATASESVTVEPIDRILKCEQELRKAARAVTYTPATEDFTDSMSIADFAYEVFSGHMDKVYNQADKDGMVVPVAFRQEHDKLTEMLVAVQAFGSSHSTEAAIRPILIAMSLIMTAANIEDVHAITGLKSANDPVVGFKDVHAKWLASLQ